MPMPIIVPPVRDLDIDDAGGKKEKRGNRDTGMISCPKGLMRKVAYKLGDRPRCFDRGPHPVPYALSFIPAGNFAPGGLGAS